MKQSSGNLSVHCAEKSFSSGQTEEIFLDEQMKNKRKGYNTLCCISCGISDFRECALDYSFCYSCFFRPVLF